MSHHPTNLENVEPRPVAYATPTEVQAMQGRCLVLDVRTPTEFSMARIHDAVLRPLGSIRPEEIKTLAAGREVIVICEGGMRAERAAAELRRAVAVIVATGGMKAWRAAGLPMILEQRRGLPLERQVFIAAGGLILLGVALGTLVHPWFYALAGFVGAGLVFAGATGTCGMALLLAKMPWNRGAMACELLGGDQ